jgi:hypothetical protein
MQKKGALNLSIQAIVIIVLAMTLLGLGLNFIRTQINTIQETALTVQEQTRQAILDDLRVGNKKLSFPTERLTLTPKERKDLALGVQNLEDVPIEFLLVIQQRDATGAFKNVPSETNTDGGFFWDDTEQDLGQGQSRVIPILHQAAGTKDTYLYKLNIVIPGIDGDFETNPATGGIAGDDQVYDAKTFFVSVV